jgi:dipeptide/tripeptide permease
MTENPETAVHPDVPGSPAQVRHEAFTMALYVSICLLAALGTLTGTVLTHGVVFELVWGTTVGLAVAHLFAFLLAGRLLEGERLSATTRRTALAQLAGAASVAIVTSVVILIVPTSAELNAARYDLALIIGIVGYLVARRSSRSRLRAVVFAVCVLVIGMAVVVVKQRASGH